MDQLLLNILNVWFRNYFRGLFLIGLCPFPPPASRLQIGGTEEYRICQGIGEGRITKPVVCWCIGTCATMFSSEVRYWFPHNVWIGI